MENLHAVSYFNTKHLVFWTTPKSSKWVALTKVELSRVKYFQVHVFVSTLNYISPIGVQTVIEFTNWIPKIMVHFRYLRLYFGIDNVSRRKYKFHVLKRKIADFFEPSYILFGQIQS